MKPTDLPKVDLPEGRCGPWRLIHFTVDEQAATFDALRNLTNGRNRTVTPGTYTALKHDQRGIVMSDTPAEARDHLQVMEWVDLGAKTFLIHGLGLGLITTWLISDPRVDRVDVVETDSDVIKLVGSHLISDKLHIHHGDAFTYQFPPEQRWDAAWHDIWDSINDENLDGMIALEERYQERVTFQGSWARDLCEAMEDNSYRVLAEVYRQRGKAIGDEAAARAGLRPLGE